MYKLIFKMIISSLVLILLIELIGVTYFLLMRDGMACFMSIAFAYITVQLMIKISHDARKANN